MSLSVCRRHVVRRGEWASSRLVTIVTRHAAADRKPEAGRAPASIHALTRPARAVQSVRIAARAALRPGMAGAD